MVKPFSDWYIFDITNKGAVKDTVRLSLNPYFPVLFTGSLFTSDLTGCYLLTRLIMEEDAQKFTALFRDIDASLVKRIFGTALKSGRNELNYKFSLDCMNTNDPYFVLLTFHLNQDQHVTHCTLTRSQAAGELDASVLVNGGYSDK